MNVLALLLFLVCACNSVAATICSLYNGLESACYTFPDCRVNTVTAPLVCSNGAPTTCEMNYRDAVKCSVNSTCAINSQSEQCYTLPLACTTLAPVVCSSRSDCTLVSGTTCTAGAAANTCGSYATQSTCTTGSCLWDTPVGTTGQCFNNMAEVTSLYPYGTWGNYPNYNTTQCQLHGGIPGSGDYAQFCYSSGTAAPVSTAVVSNFSSTLSVLAASQAQQMTFTVSIPTSYFINPRYPHFITFKFGTSGLTGPSYDVPSNSAPICTSQMTPPAYGAQLGPLHVPINIADISAYIQAFIAANGTLAYSATTLGNQAVLTTDRMAVNATNRVTSISVVGATTIFYLSANLPTLVSTCGASTAVTSSSTTFTVPFKVMSRGVGEVWNVNSYTLQSTAYTGGTVSLVVQQSPFRGMQLGFISDVSNICSAGQMSRNYPITLTYYDPSGVTAIGIRNSGDIVLQSNCYGTVVTSVVPPTSCPLGLCTSIVNFRDTCNPVTNTDGDDLNLCTRFPGGGALAALNYVHDFKDKPYSWRQSTGVTDASAVPQASDTVNGDIRSVSITQKVGPTSAVIVQSNRVFAGFLPSPDADISLAIALWDSNANAFAGGLTGASVDRSFFVTGVHFVMWIVDPALRQLDKLVSGTGAFSPLDAFAASLGVTPVSIGFDFTSLRPHMTRLPRSMCPTAGNMFCPRLGAVDVALGVEGFSLPYAYLTKTYPAAQYGLNNPYSIVLHTTPGRRLLSIDGYSSSTSNQVALLIQGIQVNQTIIVGTTSETRDSQCLASLGSMTTSEIVWMSLALVLFVVIIAALGWFLRHTQGVRYDRGVRPLKL